MLKIEISLDFVKFYPENLQKIEFRKNLEKMDSATSVLHEIVEAEHKALPDKIEEFRSIGKEYKNVRMGAIITVNSLIGGLVLGAVKDFPKNKRSIPVNFACLAGLGISSYYLTTSMDHYISRSYYGKILKTVNIDQDILDLMQEENSLHYEVLNKFKYR